MPPLWGGFPAIPGLDRAVHVQGQHRIAGPGKTTSEEGITVTDQHPSPTHSPAAAAQQLHALGRARSLELAKNLGTASTRLTAAGTKVHDAKVGYAKAADGYRSAWADAQQMFTAAQLTELGFPTPPPAPQRRAARTESPPP